MEVHGDNDYAMEFHSQPATPTKYQEVPNEGSSSYDERHWVPQCPGNYIPKVGMVLKDLDDAIRFYRAYAAEAGFDVRKTTTTKKEGSVVWQYVVCSREGKKHVPTISHNDASHVIGQAALSKPGRRRRISKRIGCMARVAFRILGHDGYVLSIFEEQHNHPLTSLPYRPFLRINRNIDLGHKKFILNCAKANIGTMKSYRLFKESVGGYMMIFAPFTGVDNHKKCVTFGFGLLSSEDAESYSWLLRSFMNAMGNAPSCIITDQDPSLRIAIEAVLPQTKHRYCMWHIMNKLSGKVCPVLSKDTEFMNRINQMVWTHYLDKKEWKAQWRSVMADYNLTEHSWFKSLYTLRKFWILAYFRDLFMAGLLRTTSRSESENSFFDDFTNRNFSLVELLMQFQSAMEDQCFKFTCLNSESESGIPVFKTPLKIEKQDASLFTLSVFYDVQKEICASCFSCAIVCIQNSEDASEYQISDVSGMISTVRYCARDGTTHCSCKNYERIGLLWRHIFVVFKNLKIEKIPDFYVTNRWCKFHLLKPMFDVGGSEMDKVSFTDQNKTLVSRLMSDIHFCIALVEHTLDLLLAFSNTINQHKEALIDKLQDGKLSSDTSSVFENFCGTSAPSEVLVLPPAQVSTKGSGKRIKGGKEVSIEE
ncbi:unnamed protein product [Cuscuta campestris]|uniref:Uncharacterized protein n=1 Tax=Cuscuta campestris TaxID=132261 RepID=A0A484MJJ0_9ASTE|nr:unnamed protein product [Cuscuta campestris]